MASWSRWILGLFCIWLCAGVARAEEFPADAGALNVRDFGARGDGHTDDTAALLAAIAATGPDGRARFWRNRLVYLPPGTYLVSAPLLKRYKDGHFASGMALIGAGVGRSIIRLADRAPGYRNALAPRAVIFTTSKLLDPAGPTGGGKDYFGKGEGNDAYENFVEDLSVEIGAGDPGAIGIDFLASNIGAVRHVAISAPPGSGAIGLSLRRKWPGPALLQHVTIDGFDVGIDAANSEYGMTLEDIRLRGQRVAGLRNAGNALSVHTLDIAGTAPALLNTEAGGLIVLADSRLQSAGPVLWNQGVVVLRDSRLSGAALPAGIAASGAPLTGVLTAGSWQPIHPAWRIAAADPPPVLRTPSASWARVGPSGKPPPPAPPAVGDPPDNTEAIRRALNSGAATVYLPFGHYGVFDAIDIPPSVRRIVGMNATIRVLDHRKPEFTRDAGIFRILAGGPPLRIEHLIFDNSDLGNQISVQIAAAREVELRDVVSAGGLLLTREAAGGRLFIENVCCAAMRIAGAAPVYVRQFDSEGGGVRIEDSASPLWLLGIKTEGAVTAIAGSAGARAELLGGLLYMVGDTAPGVSAFTMTDAALQASYVEESIRPGSHYALHLIDTEHGTRREVPAAALPARGYGRMVPWLTAPLAASGAKP